MRIDLSTRSGEQAEIGGEDEKGKESEAKSGGPAASQARASARITT